MPGTRRTPVRTSWAIRSSSWVRVTRENVIPSAAMWLPSTIGASARTSISVRSGGTGASGSRSADDSTAQPVMAARTAQQKIRAIRGDMDIALRVTYNKSVTL